MGRTTRLAIALVLTAAVAGVTGIAGAHSGGTDSSGGHYCREAGYEAGTCSPLNSYHYHNGGGGGGGDSEPDHTHDDPDVYRAAPSANTGTTMRASRMLNSIERSREHHGWFYYRSKFPHWVDNNGDGCDTRQAVLISESRVRAGRTDTCTVTSGRWASLYDGERWHNPSSVDIDHVVALREAWVSGAHNWTRDTRRRYANDLQWKHSLRAVTDNVNSSKGDRDPAEWLPSEARCQYAINWVQVKYRWRLKADRAELRTLGRLLDSDCGARRIDVPRRAR